MLNDLDYAIGRPRLLRNFRKKMRCIHTAFTGCGMWTDHDRISCHQCNQDLVVDGGDRVGGWRQCQDHPSWPGNLNHLAGLINPRVDKVLFAVKVDQRMCGQLVLDFFVRRDTESGLLHCPVRITTCVLMSRVRDSIHNRHRQCLVKPAKNLRRPACPFEDNISLPSKCGRRISDID